jgi:uncharacterized protein YfaT (DUF1175 family)
VSSPAPSPDATDFAGDGTPDFLRFDSERDRLAFRRWFTFLAEVQYFLKPSERPPEIKDCAALIRYAYREALRRHDGRWATEAGLPFVPAMESPGKYAYPYTPLGAGLFRVRPGAFVPSNLTDGSFAQFADVKTLRMFNTHFVSRNFERAQPGDLLFYRQPAEHMPFHSMIFCGRSRISEDAASYVVYHTGPTGADPGEVRRWTDAQLVHYPEPQWRPVASNPSFLGVYRWNILREVN